MSLKLKDVNVTNNDELILQDIDHEFSPGKIYILIGRTTAGKTSLMRTIAGLLEVDSGEVTFNGVDLDALPVWERKVSMVYQQFINYPNMNVLENVSFPLLRGGVSKDEAEAIKAKLEAAGAKRRQLRHSDIRSGPVSHKCARRGGRRCRQASRLRFRAPSGTGRVGAGPVHAGGSGPERGGLR